MQSPHLIVVSTFRSVAEAEIAKGILDNVGIQSMIRSDNAGCMYPAIAGADLLVKVQDVDRANQALKQQWS